MRGWVAVSRDAARPPTMLVFRAFALRSRAASAKGVRDESGNEQIANDNPRSAKKLAPQNGDVSVFHIYRSVCYIIIKSWESIIEIDDRTAQRS
jgi:hypothetical protein